MVVSLLQPGSTLQQQNPANDVPVSYYQNVTGSSAISNTYFTLSGTSMATPVVSGAAALLLQDNPKLTPDQVKAILMKTAYKTFPQSSSVFDPVTGNTYTDYYDIFTVGAGYLDVAAALPYAKNPPAAGAALSPIAVYDPNSGAVTVNLNSTSLWALQSVLATRTVWGAQTVWGAGVLDSSDRCLWGARSVWGASDISSSNTIWGARTMWGASGDSSARTMWGANTVSASSVMVAGEQNY
jgi:serine protease AprX